MAEAPEATIEEAVADTPVEAAGAIPNQAAEIAHDAADESREAAEHAREGAGDIAETVTDEHERAAALDREALTRDLIGTAMEAHVLEHHTAHAAVEATETPVEATGATVEAVPASIEETATTETHKRRRRVFGKAR